MYIQRLDQIGILRNIDNIIFLPEISFFIQHKKYIIYSFKLGPYLQITYD